MKGEKKRKKMQVAPPGFEPAPQLPGPCDHCAIRTLIIILKYFSLPFTLFEPCGAVFIMNSKKQLRKNSLNEYFKAISHYSSFIHSRALQQPLDERTCPLLRCSRWSSGRRSFGFIFSTARFSSHSSNRALLCLQPAVICLRNTLWFAEWFANIR